MITNLSCRGAHNKQKEKLPLVSVILPTFDRRRLLAEAVGSVLLQSFKDFELIIVDDGSTDGTSTFILGLDDPRIIYVRQPNRGEYAATNIGFKMARGALLTVMHSDDVMPRESLARRVSTLLAHPMADFCHGAICFINHEGKIISMLDAVDWSAGKTFRHYLIPVAVCRILNMVHFSSIMCRRTFMRRVGFFDESLPYSGDYEWTLRALARGRMVKAKGILYHYRMHGDQRIAKEPAIIDTEAVMRRIHRRFIAKRGIYNLPFLMSLVYFIIRKLFLFCVDTTKNRGRNIWRVIGYW